VYSINTLKNQENYTINDIYELPDGKRAELIDGQIYYMAPPSTEHQRISEKIYTGIYQYINEKEGGCEVFAAPFAVFLDKTQKTYVEPDISVICDKNKITSKGCIGAPDWVIEIVSISSKRMDYLVKLLQYSNAGVREYWIVDPLKSHVMVYNFENQTMEEYSFGENIPAGIYNGFSIKI